MKKFKVDVPGEIEYLSQWADFSIPNEPCILNKQITGCGFTQWALTNRENVILCSPRRVLLENKEDWFQKLDPVEKSSLGVDLYYARNDYDTSIEVSIDQSIVGGEKNPTTRQIARINEAKEERARKSKEYIIEFQNKLKEFIYNCGVHGKFLKILVTYDSYRKVRDVLKELGIFGKFRIVVDEMQSLWTDAAFKADVELEFVNFLQDQDNRNVCFVSATPMMDSYLEMLDEFKNLKYLEMDWGAKNPARLKKPKINMHPTTKIVNAALEIVQKYRTGNWDDTDGNSKYYTDPITGNIQEIQSKEAVFYINSVKNICDIISKAGLKPDECNIICANTDDNKKRLKAAFGLLRKKDFKPIGKIPGRGEQNKMFTFCTRTVYLGADFYSNNARSFIFSDANSKCLIVDIALDLPQILGRQRSSSNPWKSTAEFYYFSTRKDKKQTLEDFKKEVEEKIMNTNVLLDAFENSSNKKYLLNSYAIITGADRYNSNYLSFNCHDGSSKKPVFNNYIYVAELRAFQIAQGDYVKDCYVRSSVNDQFYSDGTISYPIEDMRRRYNSVGVFEDKIKMVCAEVLAGNTDFELVVEDYMLNYIRVLGIDKIRALSYHKVYLDNEMNRLKNNQTIDLPIEIYREYSEGDKVISSELKIKLKELYKRIGYIANPKAADINNWFETKPIKLKDSTGKWVHGFELVKRK